MFDSVEIHYLRKLLDKLKYSELDPYEMNELSFNPIVNRIIEKLRNPKQDEYTEKFYQQHPNVKRFCFEFENSVGIAIRERLKYLNDSSFQEIRKWNKEETEEYVKDILGSINCENTEFDKLVVYLTGLAKQKTCS